MKVSRLVNCICGYFAAVHGSLDALRMVDVQLLVCGDGTGHVEATIWPDNSSSATYTRLAGGFCGNRSQAFLPSTAPPAAGALEPLDRKGCQALCDRNESCGSYDFCSGPGCLDRCRLFPSTIRFNEILPEPSADCYMKQVYNTSKPHVMTFFRTSAKDVSVDVQVTDSSKTPKILHEERNLTLAAFESRRRLEEGVPHLAAGAARRLSAPPRRGKGVGGHGGHSAHRSSHSSRAGTSSGRLGNGGRTAHGERAAGRFANPWNSHIGTYGYSMRQMGTTYPSGYTATSYGYSGLSAYSHSTPATVFSSVANAYLFSRLMTLGGMHSWHPLGRPNNSTSLEGNASNATAVGNASNLGNSSSPWNSSYPGVNNTLTPAPPAQKEELVEVLLDVDLQRDDLMSSGFVPSEYTYPLRVRISRVAGEDFLPDRICPPAGWHPNASSSKAEGWSPPDHQDLFFSLTQLEELEWQPGDPRRQQDEGTMFFLLLLMLFSLFFVARLCRCSCPRNLLEQPVPPSKGKELSAAGRQLRSRVGKSPYEPVPIKIAG